MAITKKGKAGVSKETAVSWSGRGHMGATLSSGMMIEPEAVALAQALGRAGQPVDPCLVTGQAGQEFCPGQKPQRVAYGVPRA